MNIFKKFLGFFASILPFLKSEYDRLPADQKADVDAAIQAGEIIKANVSKAAPEVLAQLENDLGIYAATKIQAVLAQVAANRGITVTATAPTPVDFMEAILADLRGKNGTTWEDAVFDTVKYIVVNLTGGSLTRSIAIIIIQFVYDHVFKPKAVATIPVVSQDNASVAKVEPVNDQASQNDAGTAVASTSSQNIAVAAATEPAPGTSSQNIAVADVAEPIPETPGFLDQGAYVPPAKPADPAADSFITPGAYTPPA